MTDKKTKQTAPTKGKPLDDMDIINSLGITLTAIQRDIVQLVQCDGLTIGQAAMSLNIPIPVCNREYSAAAIKICKALLKQAKNEPRMIDAS